MPDWTDRNDADPGMTVLALLAWLALGLLAALAYHAYARRRPRDVGGRDTRR